MSFYLPLLRYKGAPLLLLSGVISLTACKMLEMQAGEFYKLKQKAKPPPLRTSDEFLRDTDLYFGGDWLYRYAREMLEAGNENSRAKRAAKKDEAHRLQAASN